MTPPQKSKPVVKFSDQLVRFRREPALANGRNPREVRGEILRKLLARKPKGQTTCAK